MDASKEPYMSDSYCIPLNSASAVPLDLVGGKAQSLGLLTNKGFLVPPGFVVTSDALICYLQHNLIHIPPDIHEMPCTAALDCVTRVKNQIFKGDFPKPVRESILQALRMLSCTATFAVRSSAQSEDGATSSWAGMLKTFLGVREAEILRNIKACWASIFNETLLIYIHQHQSGFNYQMGVVVQEMIHPSASGVAFSVDPVDNNPEHLIVEIVSGACENLVSGESTPDRYVLLKSDMSIVSRNLQSEWQIKITRDELCQLAHITSQLAQLINAEVDVEWGIVDDKIHVLQIRPITTYFSTSSTYTVEHGFQYWWSDSEAYWAIEARAQILEKRRNITWNEIDNLILYTRKTITEAYLSEADVAHEFSKGNKYFSSDFLDNQNKLLHDLLTETEKFKDYCRTLRFDSLSNNQLNRFFNDSVDLFQRLVSHYKSTGPNPTTLIGDEISYYLNKEQLSELDKQYIDEQLEEEQYEFAALQTMLGKFEFISLIDQHLVRFPWLALNCFECEKARDTLVARPSIKNNGHGRSNGNNDDAIRKMVPSALLNAFLLIKRFRTKIKLCWASFDFLMIPFFAELARRTGESSTAINRYYRTEDIRTMLRDGIPLSLEEKNRRNDAMLSIVTNGRVSFYTGEEARNTCEQMLSNSSAETAIKGSVACSGKAETVTGHARILACNDPESLLRVREVMVEGDILVTAMTQFNTLDLVAKAGGIITDEGGILCHASIIAREMSVPCITGTKCASMRIRDGELVTMNLLNGSVAVHSQVV